MTHEVRMCCETEMLHDVYCVMNEEGEFWICPKCFNCYRIMNEQLDMEDAFNMIGGDPDVVPIDATDEEIEEEFRKQYKEGKE